MILWKVELHLEVLLLGGSTHVLVGLQCIQSLSRDQRD